METDGTNTAKKDKIRNIFVPGAISPEKIADMIRKHQPKTGIGAHDIFLGQVRADVKDRKTVTSIEYTAYEEMANQVFHQLKEEVFERYQLTCLHVLHSLGKVNSGEISLVVFVSSPHRKDCFDATRELVERIKKDMPVWGKEIFEDQSSTWKVNT